MKFSTPEPFTPFRSRNYALYWTGTFFSNTGTWMQSVALGWLIYDLTGAASWLGLVSFAANCPALFVAPIGGAVADRADHKAVLVGTQAVTATCAVVLAVLTAARTLELWHVLALAVTSGVASSLYMPVAHAMLPSLVPAERLVNAISLNSVNFNLARILGPIAAGLAYGVIGPAGCFLVNAASFLVLMGMLSRLRLPARARLAPESIRRQLAQGIEYVRGEPKISTMLVLAAGVSLCGFPYIILMPAVARDRLGLGPDGLGLMMATLGFGAVIGGLGLAWLGRASRKSVLAVGSAAALGAALVVFALARTLRVAAPALFLLGVLQVACVASMNTALQVAVTDAMRGRVMSLATFCFFGLSTLGSLLLGALGDAIGVSNALVAGGAAIVILVAVLAGRSPVIFSSL